MVTLAKAQMVNAVMAHRLIVMMSSAHLEGRCLPELFRFVRNMNKTSGFKLPQAPFIAGLPAVRCYPEYRRDDDKQQRLD